MRDKHSSSPQVFSGGNEVGLEEDGLDGGGGVTTGRGVGSGDGGVTSGNGEELMCVRKSLLDAIVLHQARRITELERKLERRRQMIERLSAIQTYAQQQYAGGFRGGGTDGITQVYVGDGTKTGAGDGSTAGPDLLAKEAAAKCLASGANVFGGMMGAIGTGLPGMGIGAGMGMGMGMRGFGMGMGMGMGMGCMGGMGKGVGMVGGEKKQSRYWTADEHERFLAAVKTCGPKNYQQIAEIVGTRNAKQVRTHAQKFQKKLEREAAKRRAAAAAMTAAARSSAGDGVGIAANKIMGLADHTQTCSTDASNSVSPVAAAAAAACSQVPHMSSASIAAAEAAATAAAAAAVEAEVVQSGASKDPEEYPGKRWRESNQQKETTLTGRKSKRLRLSEGGSSLKEDSEPSSSGTSEHSSVKYEAKVVKSEPALMPCSFIADTESKDDDNDKDTDHEKKPDEQVSEKVAKAEIQNVATNPVEIANSKPMSRKDEERSSNFKKIVNKPLTRSQVKRENGEVGEREGSVRNGNRKEAEE